MASKSIIYDLTERENLDGLNYDMLHRKIQYLVKAQKMLETLTTIIKKKKKSTPDNDTNRRRRARDL